MNDGLTDQEVVDVFVNTRLEGDYNFLTDDLVKLANAFVKAAEERIRLNERTHCVDIAKSLNRLVGEKIEELRK